MRSSCASLGDYFAEHAGSSAKNCGELPFDADFFALTPVLQCALRASARGEAFRVVRYVEVLDSGHGAIGLVGKGDGRIERFRQSAIECPGPPCGEHYWFVSAGGHAAGFRATIGNSAAAGEMTASRCTQVQRAEESPNSEGQCAG